jgi:hypothetical protein
MFSGFKLDLKNIELGDRDFAVGEELYKKGKQRVHQKLTQFISPNGTIDGSALQQHWFPDVEADVFISHSHRDRKLAISLAGWLFDNMGIISFIDSCIWGYAPELLKEIDDRHCWNKAKQTYSYELRNLSTSHVHMMLSTALTMMIDKSESLFFLDTPNSVETSEIMTNTYSPWLYSELAMSRVVRIKNLSEYRYERQKGFSSISGDLNESLEIAYRIDLDHLKTINANDLAKWNEMHSFHVKYPLDVLYKIMAQKNKSIQLR